MNTLDDYLTGQLLVAMPGMPDPRFSKTVIYICAHSEEGAMGLILNRLHRDLTFAEIIGQLGIVGGAEDSQIRVHFGGPVETGRGFVLHSAEYIQDTTMTIDETMSLTATADILRAIAQGHGPSRMVLALGYAGWSAGQLDEEIKANGWLNAPADRDIVFGADIDHKWEQAINKLGFDVAMLSTEAGHA
ncbi:MAG: YqgE/AlgH family protein [Rhodospirillales bacterium]|nr:YqgE/AlgH family protein [Rhodospirillales bacterium]MCW8862960.1 YqgE/AlgH family protein [Rhodospirillales bacterium]MCW8951973.1 YqgE/AlgH family protein [Rhodospirillales bacterium]MCW8971585.1 YqgE/AlgH family protein [Rhodospirillales bacterium]MCW9002379.1 YqgE/AlgH family protein [Rhodospirillales bacterium]